MFDIVIKAIPIIFVFLFGVALRHIGIFNQSDADRFLQVVVYVALPALILLSIGKVTLEPELAYLPATAVFTIIATYPAARVVGRSLSLPRATMGVFLIGPMIMNLAVLFPFVLAIWGPQGIARLALFDMGNAVLALTLVYAIACRHGDAGLDVRATLRRLANFPPLWALLAGLTMNIAGVHDYPAPVRDFLDLTGNLMVPLLMLSLGIYFEPKLVQLRALLAATLLRAGLGLTLGMIWVTLFDIQGLNRAVVLLGTAAPVGFNTLVFANRENLDRGFASSLASVSLLLALIYIPIAMYWLH